MMLEERLRVVKVTKDVNYEKDKVQFKVILKSRDDNVKLTIKLNEREYKQFKNEFSIYGGSELLMTLDQFQRRIDEFTSEESDKSEEESD